MPLVEVNEKLVMAVLTSQAKAETAALALEAAQKSVPLLPMAACPIDCRLAPPLDQKRLPPGL